MNVERNVWQVFQVGGWKLMLTTGQARTRD